MLADSRSDRINFDVYFPDSVAFLSFAIKCACDVLGTFVKGTSNSDTLKPEPRSSSHNWVTQVAQLLFILGTFRLMVQVSSHELCPEY